MNKKILIIGSRGMLGSELAQVFSDSDVYLWDRQDIDITDKHEVREKILWLKPNIIINSAAYTAVDKAEENRELAEQVNAYGTANLANIASELKAIFVHYSTDYVFSGKRKNGYKEDDKPGDPVNAYGASKLLGEQKLLEVMPLKKLKIKSEKLKVDKKRIIAVGKLENNPKARFYLIRLSWLFGKNGKNFIDTILQLAKERDSIKVVDDQFGKPTYAPDLAKKTRNLLENKEPFGIYHLPNQGVCSWYEFAKQAIDFFRIKTQIVPCMSKEFPRPAKRPRYSILLNTKTEPMRHWREALRDYLKNNQNNQDTRYR